MVSGQGVWVWGVGRRVEGLGYMVWGSGVKVPGGKVNCPDHFEGSVNAWVRVWGLGFGVWGLGCMVWGLGSRLRVWG